MCPAGRACLKKFLLLALIVFVCVSPCLAGIAYTAVVRGDAPAGAKAAAQDGTINGWASGQNGKVEFIGNANPMMPSGSYLITRDGARTLVLVDPTRKTYSKFDVQAMLDATGGMMQGMKSMMKMQFESPKIEKLLEEDGGLIAGLPTRHYKYRTTYTVNMQFMGSHRTVTILEEDIWATTKTLDPAMGIWLKKQPAKTGDEELDAMIAAEMNKVSGFPLKRVSVTTTESEGRKQTFRNEMEVTRLTVKPVPLSTFQIPTGYKEQPMVMPNMQGPKTLKEMQEEE
jgi:hypothetical protein